MFNNQRSTKTIEGNELIDDRFHPCKPRPPATRPLVVTVNHCYADITPFSPDSREASDEFLGIRSTQLNKFKQLITQELGNITAPKAPLNMPTDNVLSWIISPRVPLTNKMLLCHNEPALSGIGFFRMMHLADSVMTNSQHSQTRESGNPDSSAATMRLLKSLNKTLPFQRSLTPLIIA